MKSSIGAFGLISRWMVAAVLLLSAGNAQAEVASIYGGRDGLCGHRTANGERLNCAAMTAAHRTLPFGTALPAKIAVMTNARSTLIGKASFVCVTLAPSLSPLRIAAGPFRRAVTSRGTCRPAAVGQWTKARQKIMQLRAAAD